MKILTSKEVADELGITPQRVRQLAHARNLGRIIGRDFVFTAGDLKKMRKREPGNPNFKKKKNKRKK